MIEESFCKCDIALQVAQKIEKQVLGFEVIVARALIAVSHYHQARLCLGGEFGSNVLPDIACFGREFYSGFKSLPQICASKVSGRICLEGLFVDL